MNSCTWLAIIHGTQNESKRIQRLMYLAIQSGQINATLFIQFVIKSSSNRNAFIVKSNNATENRHPTKQACMHAKEQVCTSQNDIFRTFGKTVCVDTLSADTPTPDTNLVSCSSSRTVSFAQARIVAGGRTSVQNMQTNIELTKHTGSTSWLAIRQLEMQWCSDVSCSLRRPTNQFFSTKKRNT